MDESSYVGNKVDLTLIIDGCGISGMSLKKTYNVWLSHTKTFYCYGVQY